MNAFWGKLMSSVLVAVLPLRYLHVLTMALDVLRNKWKRHRYHSLDGVAISELFLSFPSIIIRTR